MSSPDDFIAPKCHDDIEILHQDESILLINKPSKLLSLSGKNPANLDSVHYRIRQQFPTAIMIHRLDLGTSGIMILALNKDIARLLNRQFSERLVTKTYTALLSGHLKSTSGVIDFPIAKGEFPYQKICSINGKPSLTEYQCLSHEFFRHNDQVFPVTRILYKPLTGRTHQLRIHSQQIGHPIIGCDLYTSLSGDTEFMSDRLMLHANQLEFQHPISEKKKVIHCNCPF